MKPIFFLSILLFTSVTFSQKIFYPTASIPDSLKQNANAVVRLNEIQIEIISQRHMRIKTKRVVTVLNERGQNAIDATEYYNKRSTINSIDATVYNSFGAEIKNIKQKDFKDYSNYDGFSLLSDTRILALDYTPTQYPFTIVYESVKTTTTTAFIPSWVPISDYFVGLQKTTLSILFPTDLGFKTKEIRFDGYPIKKTADTKLVVYELQNIPAIKPEDLAPASGFLPKLMMAVEKFNLEGVDGTAATWKEYGLWFSEKILKDTDDLSDDAKQKAKELVGAETDPIKKAKIIYKYVQSKTRYISVQVGIGGFKPMHAKEVDRLGYGDCKALTNYTKSLLAAVDVPSYYTELFGDRTKLDIMSDFASLQGNHVMLCIPNNSKNIFLECTSQTNPFGYQANFTDDRSVLILKPDGGEIVKTKQYTDQENTQISNGKFELDENGNITGSISIISEGSQYGKKLLLEKLTVNDKDKHYKEYWDNIANLKIVTTDYKNDNDKISFDEAVTITAENYGKMNGNDMLIPINCYNHYTENLSRIRNRKTPFEIQRGFYDVDEIEVNIPKNLTISFIPANVEINNKYATYKTEIIRKDAQKLIYKRSFLLKSGIYPKTEYESYRQTIDQIERNDNAKLILTKN